MKNSTNKIEKKDLNWAIKNDVLFTLSDSESIFYFKGGLCLGIKKNGIMRHYL